MSSAPKPMVAPSSRHVWSRVSWSMSIFVVRVARVASAAAAGPDRPVRSSSSSISLRRFEKCFSTLWGIPATSATPSWTGSHSTPRRCDSSLRSAVWNTVPAAIFDRYRACPSSALHRPSGPLARFATRTWVCSCGSPARLVRWLKPAAMNPAARSRRVPHCSNGAVLALRLFDPRRTKHASRSSHPIASSTAWSMASTMSSRTRTLPKAYMTDTDFGRRERQVESGNSSFPGADLCAVRGESGAGGEAGEHRSQVLAGDVVGEVEKLGSGADPASFRLGVAGVVVVETTRDLAQVVRLGADSELPQGQHDTLPKDSRIGSALRGSCPCSTFGAYVWSWLGSSG